MRIEEKKKCISSIFLLFICMITFSACTKEKKMKEDTSQPKRYQSEDLGRPIRYDVDIEFVTHGSNGKSIAWAGLHSAEHSALIGVNTHSGEVRNIDLTSYGSVNSTVLFKYSENIIYIFAGQPGRFFQYNIKKDELAEIGDPTNATYWMKSSHMIAPDGKLYMGTYPNSAVAVLDPETNTTKIINHISNDPNEKYVISLAAGQDGTLYFGIGMEHGELWSYDSRTGIKKQLLPANMQTYGAPQLWIGVDGNAYGSKGGKKFKCHPDQLEFVNNPSEPNTSLDNKVDGKHVTSIDQNGNLILKDEVTGSITKIPSDFEAPAHSIFSISDIHDGKLYGSSFKPGPMFSFDIHTQKLENLGYLTRGHVQVYDILSYGEGILMSSYTGGYLDFYNPGQSKSSANPRPVAKLHSIANQERAVQLTLGPDGNIYAPTYPIKGFLGGTLVRVHPGDWNVKVYEDVIHNQSLTSVVSVPETNEIFVTSTVRGGSSSTPTETSAWVFLWDTETEQVSYKTQPISGAKTYNKALMASNGMIYGFVGSKFYVFDPVKHKIVFTGALPVSGSTAISDVPASNGLLYGINKTTGQLFSINPSDNKVTILTQDDAMKGTRFAEVKSDGYLYYQDGAHLMRVKVVK